MPWISTISEEESGGLLREIYDAARIRAGRVFEIVKLTSLNPEVLRIWIDLYKALMHGPSPLSRAHREMIAVVVSQLNHCHY
jgi:alkylhydroperoxidase family enzyme